MGGYWLVVQYQQTTWKKEMRMRIRTNRTTRGQEEFEFNLEQGMPAVSGFSWKDDEKEFSWNNKLYDVIEKKIRGNKLWMRCIEDSKEKELLKEFCDWQQQEGKSGKSRTAALQLLISLFLPAEHFQGPEIMAVSPVYQDHYINSFAWVPREVITPPPRA
jgi:hypothetical protein